MIRIEFVKGVGGVVNLINGKLRDTDRTELINLEDVDRVIVDSYTAMAINTPLKALEISGYVVVFDTMDSMQVYLDQMFMMDGEIFNPGVNGLKKPAWDITGDNLMNGIVPHTYVGTDIEQELINGSN